MINIAYHIVDWESREKSLGILHNLKSGYPEF